MLTSTQVFAQDDAAGTNQQAAAAGTVSVTGQVRSPGTYQLLPAEHLSEALERAGGLTNAAYPYGAVFLRESAAREERGIDRTVLDRLIARCLQQMNVSSDDCPKRRVLEAAAAQGNPGELAGRITVTADPGVLAATPDKDPLLEPGDSIFIPARPTTVMVRGAVSHPGNYPYALHETLDDYLSLAGGATDAANNDAAFVIYPDGTAKQIEPSWFFFLTAAIPPGSTIVVPKR
ncbi:MAG: SLBB domain-containing protein [Rhizomicrobium sp.]